MNRDVIRDTLFLKKKSLQATKEDLSVAEDLLDTLKANRERCVGLAANMIGVNKRIIAIKDGFFDRVMLNPVIVKKEGAYKTKEGCLSLSGVRPILRYQTIEVEYETKSFEKKKEIFTGYTAQIIQHEVDHCNGILI